MSSLCRKSAFALTGSLLFPPASFYSSLSPCLSLGDRHGARSCQLSCLDWSLLETVNTLLLLRPWQEGASSLDPKQALDSQCYPLVGSQVSDREPYLRGRNEPASPEGSGRVRFTPSPSVNSLWGEDSASVDARQKPHRPEKTAHETRPRNSQVAQWLRLCIFVA